jgi:hypothetical protein
MPETGPGAGAAAASDSDRRALVARAAALQAQAEAMEQAYDRTVWLKYAFFFAPVPLVVCIFRAVMDAWHYYLAGAAFVLGALAIMAVDRVHLSRCEAAAGAAEAARKAADAAAV